MSDDPTVISLPEPGLATQASLVGALGKRRSVRHFRGRPLRLAQLSQLLWACQGITGPDGLRTAPSAGALYPLEVFVVAGSVSGLTPAVYRYRPGEHGLCPGDAGDRRRALASATWGQPFVAEAAAILAVTAEYRRTTGKYRRRGLRYVHMEVGHAAQNVLLQATVLGLRSVIVGAFDDQAVRRALGAPAALRPLGLIPLG